MGDYFVEILLSLLTVAFGSWSAVVYSMGSRSLEMLRVIQSELAVVQAGLKGLAKDMEGSEKALRSHAQEPWHHGAGEKLASIEARLDNFEKFTS